ncbi:hypothetical protein [Thermococcus sp.]
MNAKVAAGSLASYALLATKLNAAMTTLGVHIAPTEGAVNISTNIGHTWYISGRSIWFIKFGQPEYYIEAEGS